MKSAVTATSDSIEASLIVRTAEMSVTFLQQEYEKAKVEQESKEVSCTHTLCTLSIVDTHLNHKQCLLIKALYIVHSVSYRIAGSIGIFGGIIARILNLVV